MALDGALALSVYQVLDTEEAVAASLEDAADLKGQGDLGRGGEEPEDLHGVASDPAGEHGQTEALARLGLCIGEDLRDRERGFDGETNVADEDRVRGIDGGDARHDNFANQQAREEVDNELPVSVIIWLASSLLFVHHVRCPSTGETQRLRRPPLPEIVRPLRKEALGSGEWQPGLSALVRRGRSVIERNLEKRHLHAHHDQGLYQQARVESCAGPVEDPIVQHVHVSRMRRIRRTAKGAQPALRQSAKQRKKRT